MKLSACYTHGGLSSALGYKSGGGGVYTRGDPLGISHCSSNCQNPSHCSVTKHKRRGSEQRQCKITSAIGRALGVGYDDVPASFISQWGVTPCAGGSQLALTERFTSIFCVQALCKDFKEVSPICTMEYMPHCASNGQTYSNRCTFCNAYLYVQG